MKNSEAQRRGKRSRRKGQSFERYVADKFRDIFPDARRGIGQARSGSEIPDVVGTPFWIEAKHRKKINPYDAITQALNALGKSLSKELIPIAVTKRDRGIELVSLELSVFLDLLSKIYLREGGYGNVADRRGVLQDGGWGDAPRELHPRKRPEKTNINSGGREESGCISGAEEFKKFRKLFSRTGRPGVRGSSSPEK